MTTWPKGPYKWLKDDRLHISIPFTWNLPEIREEILIGNLFAPGRPIVGGPAVKLMPHYLADIADIGEDYPGVLQMVNPEATRTTIGCPNRCPFCAVPLIEPEFKELADWPAGRIICDNNLLAASRSHFDRVIDRLKGIKGVDFNQGLDVHLLIQYHADRLAELDALIRISWDDLDTEPFVLRAITRLRKAGIPRDHIQCYVLIGFNDTPETALYRLETLAHALHVLPNPQRFTPLDSLHRRFTPPAWTDRELTRMLRYWSNLKHLRAIRYEEFERRTLGNLMPENQIAL